MIPHRTLRPIHHKPGDVGVFFASPGPNVIFFCGMSDFFFCYKRPSLVCLCIKPKNCRVLQQIAALVRASMLTRQGAAKLLQEEKKLSASESGVLRMCDVPFCETMEIPTAVGDHTNVKCVRCAKFTCATCTQGNMEQSDNMQELPGVRIRSFSCPFCRSCFSEWSFDSLAAGVSS